MFAVGGCASTHQERVAMLEDLNNQLRARLNKANMDLRDAQRGQAEMDARLVAALDEVGSLRSKLEQIPPPAEAAPGWTPVPGGAMIAIESNILFPPGKAVLRDEARRTLDAIVGTVQTDYADKNILVIGHTDNQPIKKSGWKDNYQLSAERALSVVRYLRDRSVNPDRLVAGGCGQHRPRVPNDSPINQTRNRRVEIYALDGDAFMP
jgi:chemotaxis protein MotB